jgi:MoxR-like ATPase
MEGVNKTQLPDLKTLTGQLEDNISSVVLGKRDVARLCLVALLAGEHILLEDVPGVGKTLMGKALAHSIDGDFCRLQFTPDLLPSDILGSVVYHAQNHEFVFHPGPVFNNFVLADEINRAPPRTQSALLEAMSDGQVSIDGTTHRLPRPFMVIATQNPFEFEGTYILPESQLDRFLLRVSMGYPDPEFEQQILDSHRLGEPVDTLGAVLDKTMIGELQSAVRQVRLEASISRYMLDVVHRTRDSADLDIGVSTRGILLWSRAAQAAALLDGRDYVVPDDAKQLAVSVLSHRILLKGQSSQGDRESSEAVIRQILDQVAVP